MYLNLPQNDHAYENQVLNVLRKRLYNNYHYVAVKIIEIL